MLTTTVSSAVHCQADASTLAPNKSNDVLRSIKSNLRQRPHCTCDHATYVWAV